jgi:dTDP-4-amino-4,6-dideoxygalactose transaminase
VGTFGDLAVLGFYPNKQITTGEGGAVLVRTPEHAAKIRRLRNQGRDGQDWLDQREIGYNYRLSELECALGRVQLGPITEILEMRRAPPNSITPSCRASKAWNCRPLLFPGER